MRSAKFDKVALGEASISFLGPTLSFTAKFKLVSSKTGESFGSSTIQHWSPAVIEKLKELRAMMEYEVEEEIFEGSSTSTVSTSGIGEQFEEDEPPPI